MSKTLERLAHVADTDRPLYAAFKIITKHMQFKVFGRWEDDPDEPGEKLFCTSGTESDLLGDACLDAAIEVRNAIIEECAKVAEANWHSQKVLGNIYATGVLDAGNRIASSIRSLKTSTGEETANE